MFNKQKGFLPTITFYFGLLFGGYFLYVLIRLLYSIGFLISQEAASGMGSRLIIPAVLYIIFYGIIIFVGYIMMSLFPAIRVTDKGIEYRSFIFLRKISWDDMVAIQDTRWPKGGKALVFFRRKGNVLSYFLNTLRLYPNQTYGMLTGIHDPMILLSQSLENRETILVEVSQHIKTQVQQDETSPTMT